MSPLVGYNQTASAAHRQEANPTLVANSGV